MVHLLRSDMLSSAWRIPFKTSNHRLWEHTYNACEHFPAEPHSSCGISNDSVCLLTSLLKLTSEWYVALIVTQQGAHKGQHCAFPHHLSPSEFGLQLAHTFYLITYIRQPTNFTTSIQLNAPIDFCLIIERRLYLKIMAE